MLTQQQNDTLTRVGPDTAMGTLMRRYWVPAVLSWELPERDCPPLEVRLLGEDLAAFRQTDGRVGLVSAYCAHRRVNLFWGRNEENGIRCVYHGWKFDVDGRCSDMPSEPETSNFKDRVRIPAYPTHEAGGVVWAYMGPPEKRPAAPYYQWTQVAPEQRGLSRVWQENNWLQALEGGIDTVHSNFLHYGRPPGLRYDDSDPRGRANNFSTAPRLEVVPTDFGYTYAGIRDMGDEDTNHVRAYHWIMPWTQIRGYVRGGGFSNAGHMWVPMDDHNTMVFNWNVVFEELTDGDAGPESLRTQLGASAEIIGSPAINEDSMPIWFRDARRLVGTGNDFVTDVDPETFRPIRNRGNKYMIDRQRQKTETFTGIQGINTQDRAVQESMGLIADRSLERLGSTDRAIIATRRFLLDALADVAAGAEPPGLAQTYYGLRAFESVLPKDAHWYEAMASHLHTRESPPVSTTSP